LYKAGALDLFKPRVMIVRAAARLILQGPVTSQDRWEENAGYSPSTLATVIAALVCSAEAAQEYGEIRSANFIFAYADWLAAHVEEWTVTTQGQLVEGFLVITSASIRPILTRLTLTPTRTRR
jgi:glucoamylase